MSFVLDDGSQLLATELEGRAPQQGRDDDEDAEGGLEL